MDLHAVDDLLAHKGHSNEKLEEVDELLQHGAKISQQTTYIGGEKTLGEVEGVLEKLSGSKSGKHGILGHVGGGAEGNRRRGGRHGFAQVPRRRRRWRRR